MMEGEDIRDTGAAICSARFLLAVFPHPHCSGAPDPADTNAVRDRGRAGERSAKGQELEEVALGILVAALAFAHCDETNIGRYHTPADTGSTVMDTSWVEILHDLQTADYGARSISFGLKQQHVYPKTGRHFLA